MGEVLTGRRTVDGTRDAARPGLCAGERGTRLFGLIAGPDGPTNRARLHGRRSRQLSRMDKCQRRSRLTTAQAASVLHLTGPKVTKPFDANIDEFTVDEPQPAIWLVREKQIREEIDDSAAGKRSRGPTTCGWSPMFGCWPMTTSAASRDFETLSVPRPSLAAEFNRVSFCMRTVATHRSGTGGGTRSGMQSVSQPAGGTKVRSSGAGCAPPQRPSGLPCHSFSAAIPHLRTGTVRESHPGGGTNPESQLRVDDAHTSRLRNSSIT